MVGSLAACSLACAVPATAQEVAPPTTPDAQVADQDSPPQEVAAGTQAGLEETAAGEEKAIVVTGTRIRRPNLESQVPITSISGESFLQQSSNSIGDTLNDLPQLRSTIAQTNPGLGIGIAGLNLLDLRGLGTVRTLTLVNGRRHVGADILNSAVSPDVNTIPTDLVERVDIVTGGNSAVYGSDAIAGVVNFVLRQNYNGLQIRGKASESQQGFGANQYVSAMFGRNFDDGRGNITIHGEFAHQRRVFASDIPWLRRQDGFLVIDVDPSGLPEGSDGFPDRNLFKDIRSATINRFGLIPITQDSSMTANPNPLCGRGLGSTNGPGGAGSGSSAGTSYNCNFLFDAAGNMSAQTGTRVGSGITGSFVGGNGQTGREDELLSVLPKMSRYNFNLVSHYTVSDAFEPFIEAKWVRVDTRGSNAGPSFIQGALTQFDTRERLRLDNPYLTAGQRTQIANAILASGCRPSITGACNSTTGANRLTAADIANIGNGSFRFVIGRHLADSGIRDEEFRRDTFRIVSGARGTFNDDWNYEVSVNYGKMKEHTTTYGYLDKQRFMLALDAGIDPANPGAGIQCRAKFDPTAAVPFPNNAANVARLAADIAACVPYNPFGAADNRASADYFTYNARHSAWMSQFDIQGYVSGDSSQLFELPGGPARFVVGGEYRKEKNSFVQDPFVAGGFTNAVSIGTFKPDPFVVKELFAEVQLPLLKDQPFFEDLTISGAGRLSWYGGKIGTVKTYNAGIEWSPISDLRLRANYGRAIRAPNVSETGGPVVPNFAPGFLDPCSSSQIANNPNRAANCADDLGALLPGLPNAGAGYSLAVLSGSNPDLEPEVSDSYTVGAVIQPRFIPGLSLSVDWYKINVKNVIVALSAQQIANGCYDSPNLSSPLCALFERWRGPGVGPVGEQPGQILGNSLLQAGQNFAKRVRKGIDFEAAYRTNLGAIKLDTRLLFTRNLQISNFQDPSFATLENRIMGELGDPQNEFRWDIAATRGPVTLAYQMKFIGKMVTNLWEDFNRLEGACTPTAGCPPFNSDWADIEHYPSVTYHNIRLDYNLKSVGGIGKDYLLFVGVDNFTNKKPPLGSTATGSGSAIYNVLGRRIFAGFRARF
jgi:outer membrane receptor protein involved in Fe transport